MRIRRAALACVAVLVAGCGRAASSGGTDTSAATASPVTARASAVTPTFAKNVAPILFDHCATCHRPGQAAPFTLLSYDDAKKHADKIAEATKKGHMPPWLPDGPYGEFQGDRRLSAADLATLQAWVAGGAPEGNPADAPAAPKWPTGWQYGTPDLVIPLPRAYTVDAGTTDVFRNFVLPVALPAGRYVQAVEFQPGDVPVIHHAVISIDRTRTSRRRDGADGTPGWDGMLLTGAENPDGHFLGWTPGRGPIVAPEGMAWRLDAGADLIVQLHLLPQKKPVTVRPVVALFFSKTPPTHTPLMVKMGSKAIDIPAGEANYVITDKYVLPVDVDVLSVYPHAHFLGNQMQVLATLPDGSTRWLLQIKRWDFHWQQDYRYTTPLALPRGTSVSLKYSYDNSAENDRNPTKPPKAVVCGPNSSDEMGDLWIQVLPHSPADAAILEREFAVREVAADIAGSETLVRRNPDDAHNQAYLGSSYMAAGRVQDALSHLEYAVKLDPKSANAQNYLGGAYLTLGRIAEGVAHMREAAALDPRDERLAFNLGNALNRAGQTEEAGRAFERAVAINPNFAEAQDNLGLYLLDRNRPADALVHLKRAVELAPDNADAHNDLAAALAASNQPAAAIAEVQRALVLRPGYEPALQNLAILQKRSGRQ